MILPTPTIDKSYLVEITNATVYLSSKHNKFDEYSCVTFNSSSNSSMTYTFIHTKHYTYSITIIYVSRIMYRIINYYCVEDQPLVMSKNVLCIRCIQYE